MLHWYKRVHYYTQASKSAKGNVCSYKLGFREHFLQGLFKSISIQFLYSSSPSSKHSHYIRVSLWLQKDADIYESPFGFLVISLLQWAREVMEKTKEHQDC